MRKLIPLLLVAFVGLAGTASAQNVSTTQMSLARSQRFQDRLAYLMTNYAQTTILPQAQNTAPAQCYDARIRYAKDVISEPLGIAKTAAIFMSGTTNVVGTVQANSNPDLVDSSATDAAIFSQIALVWNQLARCPTGS